MHGVNTSRTLKRRCARTTKPVAAYNCGVIGRGTDVVSGLAPSVAMIIVSYYWLIASVSSALKR